MASNDRPVRYQSQFLSDTPQYPTPMRLFREDGLAVGVDKSEVWLWRSIPQSKVAEAISTQRAIQAPSALDAAMYELSSMAEVSKNVGRSQARASYREFHLLWANIPQFFIPPTGHVRYADLAEGYSNIVTHERIALLGVKIRPDLTGKGLRDVISSVAETLSNRGTPLSSFDTDARKVADGMARAGMALPTQEQMKSAEAWFNLGGRTDPAVVQEVDRLAVIDDMSVAGYVRDHLEGVPIKDWPENLGHSVISFGTISTTDFDFAPVSSDVVRWASTLLHMGAGAISIRGFVEPPAVTRKEMERQSRNLSSDIEKRAVAQRTDRSEYQAELEKVDRLRAMYGLDLSRVWPTLTDVSTIVGFRGTHEDMTKEMRNSPITVLPMDNRQDAAWVETLPCSAVRASPYRLDLPSVSVTHSGLVDLTRIGDAPTSRAALLGFTERDAQPAWLTHDAAYRSKSSEIAPVYFVGAGSGSGKTVLLQHLSRQFTEAGVPNVIVDPKPDSDLSDATESYGGITQSLDDMLTSDGMFDPLRWSTSRQDAIEQACDLIGYISPWPEDRQVHETALRRAITYGVNQGAGSIGQALRLALEAGRATAALVQPILDLAESSSYFQALVGNNPEGSGLRVHDGCTYIRIGGSSLPLPDARVPQSEYTQSNRVAVALVRMMVLATATSLVGRQGVVFLDEAWVFLSSVQAELARLFRLCRSQNVTIFMFTQKVRDVTLTDVSIDLAGGLIMHLPDIEEARAACALLGIEATKERLARITASATMGDTRSGATVPNYESLKALYDARTDTLLRGAVALYWDLSREVAPVEIRLPDAFLRLASTNRDDTEDRRREKESAA